MRRGEIWWANLPLRSGSGPGLRRPVVVVQSNGFNDSRISTVIVLAITSNLALAAAPGNLRISKSVSGLGRASVINASQVLTIDRTHLSKRVRALPGDVLNNINDGLCLSLGL